MSFPRDPPPSGTDLHFRRKTFAPCPDDLRPLSLLPRSSRPCTIPRWRALGESSPSNRRTDRGPNPPASPKTFAMSRSGPGALADIFPREANEAHWKPDIRFLPSQHNRKESESATEDAGAETDPAQTVHKQDHPPALAGSLEESQSSPHGPWPLSRFHYFNLCMP